MTFRTLLIFYIFNKLGWDREGVKMEYKQRKTNLAVLQINNISTLKGDRKKKTNKFRKQHILRLKLKEKKQYIKIVFYTPVSRSYFSTGV